VTTAQYVVLSIATPALYVAVSTALYMLLARDLITRGLWSRYPKWAEKFTLCAACSGTWYGLGLAALSWWQGWPFAGLPGDNVITVLVIAAWTKTFTPILAEMHIRALINTSDDEDGADHG